MEVGLTSAQRGPWRLSLNITRGTGFEGGHLEDKGLSRAGLVVTVPTHRHAVELDFVRYELGAAYNFAESWDAWLRVPYDVKERTAELELIDPATPLEVAAMQRNLDLHHPSSTLEGFSDLSLLIARKRHGLFREGDTLALALGTTIPVGETEEDPYVLGDSGRPHEHIQFGTGTFDPLLELYYITPVREQVSVSANALWRFSLQENDKGYQGPLEVSSGLTVSVAPTQRLHLRVGWSLYYQSYAHWDGERDINSGLVSSAAVGGARYQVSDGVVLSLAVRVPISQETLSDDGDAFEQGTVAQLGLSYSF